MSTDFLFCVPLRSVQSSALKQKHETKAKTCVLESMFLHCVLHDLFLFRVLCGVLWSTFWRSMNREKCIVKIKYIFTNKFLTLQNVTALFKKMSPLRKFLIFQHCRMINMRRVRFAYDLLFRSRRHGRQYVRSVNLHRDERGEFAALIQEIREHDPERHFIYFRMSVERYDFLLSLLRDDLNKKRNHRLPICASQRLAVTLRYRRLIVWSP